ncbi:hypothetical protein HDU98_001911, partial [Podochytrium sp. JEL0797]
NPDTASAVQFTQNSCVADVLLVGVHTYYGIPPIHAQCAQIANMYISAPIQSGNASDHTNAVIINNGYGNNACPNSCSGNGLCGSTECQCSIGFTGLDCSIAVKSLPCPVTPSTLQYQDGTTAPGSFGNVVPAVQQPSAWKIYVHEEMIHNDGWIKLYDATYDAYYYSHPTKGTQWERPAAFVESSEVDAIGSYPLLADDDSWEALSSKLQEALELTKGAMKQMEDGGDAESFYSALEPSPAPPPPPPFGPAPLSPQQDAYANYQHPSVYPVPMVYMQPYQNYQPQEIYDYQLPVPQSVDPAPSGQRSVQQPAITVGDPILDSSLSPVISGIAGSANGSTAFTISINMVVDVEIYNQNYEPIGVNNMVYSGRFGNAIATGNSGWVSLGSRGNTSLTIPIQINYTGNVATESTDGTLALFARNCTGSTISFLPFTLEVQVWAVYWASWRPTVTGTSAFVCPDLGLVAASKGTSTTTSSPRATL